MIYCIDIDETLCHSTEDDYAHSVPNRAAIARVNDLYNSGHVIKLFTGRGSQDGYDWKTFTERQLTSWGVRFHELLLGKPHADVFIDDKALNTHDWLQSRIEELREVSRDWGKEVWIVNCDEYCSKLLYVPKGATSELHYHVRKKETFYCLQGQLLLALEGHEIILDPLSKPVTIRPKERHQFSGTTDALILEVSTHHSEDDCVLLSLAQGAPK